MLPWLSGVWKIHHTNSSVDGGDEGRGEWLAMKGRGVGVEDKLSLVNLVSCSLLPIGVASSAFWVSARSLVSSFIFVVGIVLHCFRESRKQNPVGILQEAGYYFRITLTQWNDKYMAEYCCNFTTWAKLGLSTVIGEIFGQNNHLRLS